MARSRRTVQPSTWPSTNGVVRADLRIGVVGAGMSGLCMGVKLRQAGIDDFQIYEQADQVGGTWRDNTYPGLTCDEPARSYSYSFARNPHWSQAFAPGAEIQNYLIQTTERFGLRPYLRPMQLLGVGGRSLDEAWRDGPRAYRTVAVPDFPNFFMLIGPYSPIGNNSYVTIAETQADYILHWINRLRTGRATAVSPTREATERFHAELRAAMPNTVWTTGCTSWYLGADGLPVLWPWTPARYRGMLREPVPEHFTSAPA